MTPEQDPQLETRLRDYLAGELDGQRGRCAARFLEEMAAPIQLKPALASPGDKSRRWVWWTSLASAAALVLGLMVWQGIARHSSAPLANNAAVAPATQQEGQALAYTQTIEYRTLDQGTVVLDDQLPVRQLCRQTLERVQWIDPVKHQDVEVDIPSQEIVYVPLATY